MQGNQEAVSGQVQKNRVFLKYKSAEVEGQCILLSISPIRFIPWRFVIFLFSTILIFIPSLLIYWYKFRYKRYPKLKKKLYYSFCSLQQATDFYILNYDDQISIAPKEGKVFMIDELHSAFYIYFVNRYMTYIIDQEQVIHVCIYDYRHRISHIIQSRKEQRGLSDCQAHQLKNSYGPGTMIVQRPSYIDLLFKEVLRPLYLFLIFSIAFWIWALKYYYFSAVLFIISTIGLVGSLYQMIKINDKIFSMAYQDTQVNVLREGKIQMTSSIDVVPGDIVFLKDQIKIPFQGIILQGSALINECALTGESAPVLKQADEFEAMIDTSTPIDKNAFIYQGTTVIQVSDKKRKAKFEKYRQKYGIPVCVIRTNFLTTKGQLIRIILFPKEQQNVFERQSYKYIFFILCFTIVTSIIVIILSYEYSNTAHIVIRFITMFTITIPPALPVSMTFGIIYAVEKLKKKDISCIIQNKVITGGMIELCCFDKTGTLTEDFMDLNGIIPAHQANFYPLVTNHPENTHKMIEKSHRVKFISAILTNMATNHTIIKVQATNEIIGDPMQVKAFQFGKYRVNQAQSDYAIFCFESDHGHNGQVYRRFQFQSTLMRMSVICRHTLSQGFEIYCKGSPQAMLSIMKKNTIPLNYQTILRQYASQGFRILSIASRSLQQSAVHSISREQAEKELQFNGFYVFQNKLKPQSTQAIRTLKDAEIKCIMITGDNTLTASSISYKCGISNKQQNMIICDYTDGNFVKDKFVFQQQESKAQERSDLGKDTTFAEIVIIDNKTSLNTQAEQPIIQNESYQSRHSQFDRDKFLEQLSRNLAQNKCQLCLTGSSFNQLFPGPIAKLSQLQKQFLESITVFARTKPNDKAKIVMAFQHTDKKVSMCGDGANDCGALKQADIGLSLSQSEASISAPFASKNPNISSMVELLKECRAALATNFTLFNVLAIQTLIVYSTVTISQKFLQKPGDFQFLYWDLFLNFLYMIFIGSTKTAKELTVDRPRSSLFSVTNISQLIIIFGVQFAGQITAFVVYQKENADYYESHGGMQNAVLNYNPNAMYMPGLQTSILFVFVNNVIIATMVAFNIGRPWREPIYTNRRLMLVTVLGLVHNHIIFFWPEATWSQFHAECLSNYRIRWIMFGISWGFSLFIIFLQKIVLQPFSKYLYKKYPQYHWL